MAESVDASDLKSAEVTRGGSSPPAPIIKMLQQNEEDYWNLPMYGLIADWYLRYWYLHIEVMKYFGIEDQYEGPWPLRDNDDSKTQP